MTETLKDVTNELFLELNSLLESLSNEGGVKWLKEDVAETLAATEDYVARIIAAHMADELRKEVLLERQSMSSSAYKNARSRFYEMHWWDFEFNSHETNKFRGRRWRSSQADQDNTVDKQASAAYASKVVREMMGLTDVDYLYA